MRALNAIPSACIRTEPSIINYKYGEETENMATHPRDSRARDDTNRTWAPEHTASSLLPLAVLLVHFHLRRADETRAYDEQIGLPKGRGSKVKEGGMFTVLHSTTQQEVMVGLFPRSVVGMP